MYNSEFLAVTPRGHIVQWLAVVALPPIWCFDSTNFRSQAKAKICPGIFLYSSEVSFCWPCGHFFSHLMVLHILRAYYIVTMNGSRVLLMNCTVACLQSGILNRFYGSLCEQHLFYEPNALGFVSWLHITFYSNHCVLFPETCISLLLQM